MEVWLKFMTKIVETLMICRDNLAGHNDEIAIAPYG
jgi:hypothetical protein